MVSNAAYAAYGGQVAAWSPRVLSTLAGLGFTGVTITDALEPLAATHHVTLGQAALRAARAGRRPAALRRLRALDRRRLRPAARRRPRRPPPSCRARGRARRASRSSPRPTRARFAPMRARRIGAAVLYGRSAVRIARRGAWPRQGGAARLRRRLAALGDDDHRERARLAAGLRRPRRGPAVEGGDPAS